MSTQHNYYEYHHTFKHIPFPSCLLLSITQHNNPTIQTTAHHQLHNHTSSQHNNKITNHTNNHNTSTIHTTILSQQQQHHNYQPSMLLLDPSRPQHRFYYNERSNFAEMYSPDISHDPNTMIMTTPKHI